jgi:ribosomal protein L37AE/L43A
MTETTQPRGHGGLSQTRQAVMYCPYCAEETLFPLEAGGWECRSCLRAFSVTFLGLASSQRQSEHSS